MRLGMFMKGLQGGISKHLPQILTGAAIGLGGISMVFAAKGALEAHKRILEYEATLDTDDVSTKEIVCISAPCYIPAGLAFAGSVACMIGANKINAAKLVAAISSAVAAEKTLAENREAITQVFNKNGLKKVDQYLNETKGREYLRLDTPIYETGHGSVLCCEAYFTGVKFRASHEWVRKCVNDYNAMINEGKDPCTNEYLCLLLQNVDFRLPESGEITRMPIDHVTGRPRLMEIQIDSDLTAEGEPYLVITQRIEPVVRNFY